jgi:hypothetical protein
MKARVIALGVVILVFGIIEYRGVTNILTDIVLGIKPDVLLLVVIGLGSIITLSGLVIPTHKTDTIETINPNNMKSCSKCAGLMTPDSFRCPKCGSRQRSLYEEIK